MTDTTKITEQLAEQLTVRPDQIVKVAVYPEYHQVDFMLETGTWYWAKLTKNNRRVRKHSVRVDNG